LCKLEYRGRLTRRGMGVSSCLTSDILNRAGQ